MVLTRWTPVERELVGIRETMDRMVREALDLHRRFFGGEVEVRRLPVAVYETPEALVVKAYLPGARPEDVQVQVEQGTLTLRARIPEPAEGEVRWHLNELFGGEHTRSLALPAGLEPEQAEARLEQGVLTLRIPKAEPARPKQIPVQVPAPATA